MEVSNLTPVPRGEIRLGEACKFPVYDYSGRLLLALGQVVRTEKQAADLRDNGFFSNPAWAQGGGNDSLLVSTGAKHLPRPIAAPRIGRPARGARLNKDGAVRPKTPKTRKMNVIQEPDPAESGRLIQMGLPSTNRYHRVNLLGEIDKSAFIVSAPVRNGIHVIVRPGQRWEFRAFYGKSIFRFKATVEQALYEPYGIIILSWPQNASVSNQPVRAAKRANTQIPLSIKMGGKTGISTPGLLTNLSTGGAELTLFKDSALLCQKGEVLDLFFQIIIEDRKYFIEVQSRLMNQIEAGEYLRLGVQFLGITDAQFSALHAYVMDRSVNRIESSLYDLDVANVM